MNSEGRPPIRSRLVRVFREIPEPHVQIIEVYDDVDIDVSDLQIQIPVDIATSRTKTPRMDTAALEALLLTCAIEDDK
ncbi:MAG: hypothetical protein WA418_24515 [Bradyrhizobium sp.]